MTQGLALFALLAFQTPAPDLPKKHMAPRPKPAAVLAKVGNVTIRASDLEDYLWDWRAQEALQDLVSHQMIANEAKRLKVTVSDAVVQRELDRELAELKRQLPAGEPLEASIKGRGFPRSRLFLRIKSEQLLNSLVLRSFNPKLYVKVSTIIVRARSEQATDLADALKRAGEAHTALKNGEPWSDVLSRHSQDASTLQTEGLLGWKELSAFPPTVREELASKLSGGITAPAQTPNGIQIFRLEAKGESATGSILTELKSAYLQATRPKYLEDLRKRSKIVVRLGK